MFKLVRLVILALVVIGGGWALYNRDQIKQPADAWTLLQKQVSSSFDSKLDQLPAAANNGTIKIASFNIQTFGQKKASQSDVMDILAKIMVQFDIIAIQEIRSKDQSLLDRFVDQVNSDGHHYAYTLGDRVGRTTHQEQYAFIYNQQTIQLDQVHTYSVSDPEDLFHREPLVGWFRTRSNTGNEFTFSIANLHLDAGEPELEIVLMDDLFRAMRKDGRGEDDIILAGDFNLDAGKMHFLKKNGLRTVLQDQPTNTRQTKQYDNILLNPLATSEYTGVSGVYDFLKVHNLSLEQAIRVSDHMPVWAEFSMDEDVFVASGPAAEERR